MLVLNKNYNEINKSLNLFNKINGMFILSINVLFCYRELIKLNMIGKYYKNKLGREDW